jgi:hypothetical protein
MSQQIRIWEENKKREGKKRKTDDSRETAEEGQDGEDGGEGGGGEGEGRTGSGDWKMTIWCTRMAVFLFLDN